MPPSLLSFFPSFNFSRVATSSPPPLSRPRSALGFGDGDRRIWTRGELPSPPLSLPPLSLPLPFLLPLLAPPARPLAAPRAPLAASLPGPGGAPCPAPGEAGAASRAPHTGARATCSRARSPTHVGIVFWFLINFKLCLINLLRHAIRCAGN
jgi:hypothetical protein